MSDENENLPLPARLRKLVIGRTEWQIVEPKGGGICMWFDRDNYSNPAREAQEWLDEHKRKYPARFGNHEMKKVHILSELERAALEAADALEAQVSEKFPETLLRVDAARDFPQNTCPASRHVQLIGQTLAAGKAYPMLQEQPRYCAEDLLSVVASLYETRTELAKHSRPDDAQAPQLVPGEAVRRPGLVCGRCGCSDLMVEATK